MILLICWNNSYIILVILLLNTLSFIILMKKNIAEVLKISSSTIKKKIK